MEEADGLPKLEKARTQIPFYSPQGELGPADPF